MYSRVAIQKIASENYPETMKHKLPSYSNHKALQKKILLNKIIVSIKLFQFILTLDVQTKVSDKRLCFYNCSSVICCFVEMMFSCMRLTVPLIIKCQTIITIVLILVITYNML